MGRGQEWVQVTVTLVTWSGVGKYGRRGRYRDGGNMDLNVFFLSQPSQIKDIRHLRKNFIRLLLMLHAFNSVRIFVKDASITLCLEFSFIIWIINNLYFFS